MNTDTIIYGMTALLIGAFATLVYLDMRRNE